MSTVPDADRYMDMRLALVCPKCGSSGLIPWEHLDRILYCRRCEVFFRVDPTGMVELEETPEERLSVEVRGISSGWTRHVAVVDRPLRVGQQIQQSAISLTSSKFVRWAVVVTTTLWIVGIAMLVRREAPVVERTELPTGLDDRAVLFADALVRRDMDV